MTTRIPRLAAATALIALIAPAALAQTGVITPEEMETLAFGPHFFAALVAGVVLAIAFQLLLTNLSIAVGVSALSGVTDPDSSKATDDPDSSDTPVARMATRAYGMWALVTGSIALFFATWLATELSLTIDALAGAVLGLAIWGVFYVVTLVLEFKVMSTLFGSLVRAASSAVKTTVDGVTSAFTPSDHDRKVDLVEDEARAIAGAVKDELLGHERLDELGERLARRIEESRLDPAGLRREIEALLDHTELEAVQERDPSGSKIEELIHASLSTRSGKSTVAKKKTANRARAVAAELGSDKSAADKAIDAPLRAAGMAPDDIHDFKAKLGAILRRSERDELDPDGLRRDFEKLLSNPRDGIRALKARASLMNRETLVAFLSANTKADEQRVRSVLDRVESAARSVVDRLGSMKDQAQETLQEAEAEMGASAAGGSDSSRIPHRAPKPSKTDELKDRADAKIRDYLDGLDRPALRYETLRRDLHRIMDDPKASPDVVRRRWQSLERADFEAFVASLPKVTEEQARTMTNDLIRARDDILARMEKAERTVKEKMHEARTKALKAAEETRKVAASAAWWAFIAAAISGAAAAAGGIVGVSTGIG